MGDFPSRYADGENHHGHQRPSGCPQGREVSFLLIQPDAASRRGLIQVLALAPNIMSIRIRKEAPADVAVIEAVTVAAFQDAAHTDHTEQFVVNALRKSGQLSVSLVADDDGAIIGHVAVSPVTISDGAAGWYGLGPISVAPEHQRQGVGALLMEQALAELSGLGASGCVVLGDPGYYSRFGFKAEPSLVLPGVPPEYFQAISFTGSLPSGDVSYHESFAAQG
jgi:putative acetyltransferase